MSISSLWAITQCYKGGPVMQVPDICFPAYMKSKPFRKDFVKKSLDLKDSVRVPWISQQKIVSFQFVMYVGGHTTEQLYPEVLHSQGSRMWCTNFVTENSAISCIHDPPPFPVQISEQPVRYVCKRWITVISLVNNNNDDDDDDDKNNHGITLCTE